METQKELRDARKYVKVGDVITSSDSDSAIWSIRVDGRHMTRVTYFGSSSVIKAWSAMRAKSYEQDKRLVRGLVVFLNSVPQHGENIEIIYVGKRFAVGKPITQSEASDVSK